MIKYALYDGRYLCDPNSANCYEVCETLKEARRNRNDYGTDTVIVRETLVKTGFMASKSYMVTNSKIIK